MNMRKLITVAAAVAASAILSSFADGLPEGVRPLVDGGDRA